MKKIKKANALIHAHVIIMGFIMIYPLFWMLSSSFKPTHEIFTTKNFWPSEFTFENYLIGWNGFSGYTFTTFFINSLSISILNIIGTVISSSMAAYAFAKLKFSLRPVFFAIMLMTIMLPHHVVLIPQYIIFNKLGWINTFLPLVVPSFFGTHAFFIFLIVQYMRTIPSEITDAAYVDGCSQIRIFAKIIIPLSVPALITTAILQFMWTWNDFFGQLIYLNEVSKFTVSIGLRMFVDTTGGAMGVYVCHVICQYSASILNVRVFQRYIVEGITTGAVKG